MNLSRKRSETRDQYQNRLYMMKVQNSKAVSWNDIAAVLNKEYGQNYSPDKYRKEFSRRYRVIPQPTSSTIESSNFEEVSPLILQSLEEIRREKTLLSDLRREVNSQLRRLDREDSIKEIAKEFAKEMSTVVANQPKAISPQKVITKDCDKIGLLLLSDWHYGLEVDEAYNKYNPDICRERLGKILDQTINLIKANEIVSVYVFNLSDLISGRIHAQIRMQSRIDAVTQTMEVAELMRDFLATLSAYVNIHYYDCSDNHSRVEPNKKESLQLESFSRIIHWYLVNMFEGDDSVIVHENDSEDMIVEQIFSHIVIGVHGDNDNPSKAVTTLAAFLSVRPDLIVMGHKHHFSANEENDCMMIMNPSLIGADQYSLKLRKYSKPAQTFIIITPDNPVHAVYRLLAE